MQEFSIHTQLIFGPNALERLKALGFERIFLVTDGFFVKSGLTAKITRLCSGAQVQVFDKVIPDPPLSLVAQGVAELQAFSPDAIVALGGGSAIDCAKGILSMANSNAALVAVPTTSGTGSEVTAFAILTHEGIKHPLVEERLRPKYAILDDSLLENLPKSLIADAGMDAVAHCLEAVCAKNASPFSDALAMHAFQLLLEKLPSSYNGNVHVRGEIHHAATMAGLAFDHAGLGICHSLAHAIGGAFHLAHGRINGILLPAVLRFHNAQACQTLAKRCGLSGTRGLIFAVERLRRNLNLPATLTQAGLEKNELLQQLDALCDAALKDPCTDTNPKAVTKEDLARIVRQVL